MKKYYLKERHNPQLSKIYYRELGQLTKKDAKEYEDSLYGYNKILSFNTKKEYLDKIDELKNYGFTVFRD